MKRYLVIMFTVLLVVMSLAACSGEKLSINVPQEPLLAELGSYDLPEYQVVNEDNLIKAGYEVVVKKVVDPNGKEVTVAYNKINATVVGVYTVTYGVVEGDVADAQLKIDFADRTAPTVEIKDDALPKYYIQGMKYSLPVYQLLGEPDYDASWIKVYYLTEKGAEKQEVTIADNLFEVTHNTGFYQIVIHAEDAVGNGKDYTFTIEATGPSQVVEGKVLYSDEPFGVSQVTTLWNQFSVSYTTEKAWGDEAGSIKVVADGTGDYVILSKLTQKDVSEYDELVLRIYNDNDHEVYTGYAWFGDTVLEPHAWTELRVSLEDLNAKASHPAVAGIKPNASDLTNLALRFWDDPAANTVKQGSVFYVSAMYAVHDELTGPKKEKDDVIAYFDEAYGTKQGAFFWSDCNKQELDTTVKFGDEAASLKITCLKDNQGWNYYLLKKPYITDISKYDYIEFYVYNSTDTDFMIQLTWGGDTTCKAGEWTQVRFPVSLFAEGKITNMDNVKMDAANITSLPICFYTSEFLKGEAFYISQMRGVVDPNKPDSDPNHKCESICPAEGCGKCTDTTCQENICKNNQCPGHEAVVPDPDPEPTPTPNPVGGDAIIDLSTEAGFSNVGLVWGDLHQISFDTEIKCGSDAGSIKVTKVVDEQGWNYLRLKTPAITDISQYKYMEFYVYNNTSADFVMGLLWCGDVTCKAGAWTQVRFPVALLMNNTVTDSANRKIEATDITGLDMIFYSGSVLNGESFYISSIRAIAAEEQDPDSNMVIDLTTDAGMSDVSLFWGDSHELSYDTEFKHGEDGGSLAVTMSVDSQGWNYLVFSNPAITDISQYEYIEFYVYNNTSAAFVIGLTWCGDTTCNPGEWTQVRFATSLFTEGKVTNMAGAAVNATDIGGLPIVFYSSGTRKGESFYVSSIKCIAAE